MNPVRVTVLVENSALHDRLPAEHGLSLWIEAGGHRILFDTGQGGAVLHNAAEMGIDLERLDALVLSHGHYDHTGGVAVVLEAALPGRVVLHPDAFRARYSLHPGNPPKPIGMASSSSDALARMPEGTVVRASGCIRLCERVAVTGAIPRETDFEDTGGPFYLDTLGTRPDPILDDQALWIETDEGLVVCAGCCHAGLINTLRHVQRLSGVSTILAVIGGFHLLRADDRRLAHTIDALRDLSPGMLAACHCTGERARALLKDAFGDRVRHAAAGVSFRF